RRRETRLGCDVLILLILCTALRLLKSSGSLLHCREIMKNLVCPAQRHVNGPDRNGRTHAALALAATVHPGRDQAGPGPDIHHDRWLRSHALESRESAQPRIREPSARDCRDAG